MSKLVAPLGRNIPVHGLPLSGAAGELPLRVRLSADGPGTPVPLTLTVHFVDADGLTRASEAVLTDTGATARRSRIVVVRCTWPELNGPPGDGGGPLLS
ncbi:hypothetical protein AB0I02_08235 [Streptomyces phaeochromogenes]